MSHLYLDIIFLGTLGSLSVLVIALGFERLIFYRHLNIEAYNSKKKLDLDINKNLTLIATIGSNAPYIGLLGTVIGIMLTFIEIGHNAGINTNAIMTSLGLALKTTAAGILVAIPAIFIYNLLVRKTEIILTNYDILCEGEELGSHMRADLSPREGPIDNLPYTRVRQRSEELASTQLKENRFNQGGLKENGLKESPQLKEDGLNQDRFNQNPQVKEDVSKEDGLNKSTQPRSPHGATSGS